MGSGASDEQDLATNALPIRVHLIMCTQLLRLVDRISNVIPKIESALPQCSSGIHALCLLHIESERARGLVENCCTSKLYLAVTAENVKSRSEKIKDSLDQGLSQLQSMVPVALAIEISEILSNHRATKFFFDSREELAGKALRGILEKDESLVDSGGDSEMALLHFAASMLHIKSLKDILIERRCLRNLLKEVREGNSKKRKILRYLNYLLRKYENLFVAGQARNLSIQHNEALISAKIDSTSMTNSCGSTYPAEFVSTSLYGSLDTSSNSINSITSSMKDLDIRIDESNISLGSSDSSYGNISLVGHEHSLGSIQDSFSAEPHRFQFFTKIEEISIQFLSNVRELPWESQIAAIQDVNTYLIDYNPSCSLASSENCLDPLISFYQEALDKHDRKAQKAGSQLFLTLFQASRKPELMTEKVYALLASWLATEEAAGETLAIVEALSTEVSFDYAATSFLLTSIFKILDNQETEFHPLAFKILYKCSLKLDNSSCKLASDWIPMLVFFLDNTLIAGTCLGILKNLYQFEEIQQSAETHDLIAQILKLLDFFNHDDQEHAIDILLSLCTQHEHYCLLVLREGGIPALVYASNNGSDKGKASASELLRHLHETKLPEDVEECPTSNDETSGNRYVENSDQKSSKASGLKKWLFRKK